jgi:hypothetical protein
MTKFRVFDHLAHAELCPPPAYAVIQIKAFWMDKTLQQKWVGDSKQRALLTALAAPFRIWLDSLPKEARVSGTQIAQVFGGALTDDFKFVNAFLKMLYAQRWTALMDGYYDVSIKRNKFGKPFINYHRRQE